MKILGSHVSIEVEDIDKTFDYYTKIVGLKVIRKVSFDDGHRIIFFPGLEIHQMTSNKTVNNLKPYNLMHFGIEVENIESAVKELSKENNLPELEINEIVFKEIKQKVKYVLFKDNNGMEAELAEWINI